MVLKLFSETSVIENLVDVDVLKLVTLVVRDVKLFVVDVLKLCIPLNKETTCELLVSISLNVVLNTEDIPDDVDVLKLIIDVFNETSVIESESI